MSSDERRRPKAEKGDGRAEFDAVYAEYGGRIYRFCLRLSGNAADAEDLTQETFLAVVQGMGRFEGRSSVATWLYRIAIYRWGRMCHARQWTTTPLDEEMEGEGDHAPSSLARLSLESALGRLPEELRAAFLLVRAEGLKYREAAETLGVPQGTVQYRVHEATARLRLLLAEAGDGPGANPQTAVCGVRKRDDDEV